MVKQFCVFLIFSLFGLSLKAQDSAHTYLGILGNYEYGSPIAMNRDAGIINTFDTKGNGISWDNRFGIGACLQMPQFFAQRFGLSLTAGYSEGSGEFKSQTGTRDFQIISKHSEIGIEPVATYALSSKLYSGIGFGASFRITNDITQHTTTSQGNDTIIASGESISTSKFHFGIPLIFGGRFPLSLLFSINTEAIVRIDVGEMFRGYAKQSLSVGTRLGINFILDPQIIKPEPLLQKPPPFLAATVHFTTNGKSVKSITAHSIDTVTEIYAMLPATIYFGSRKGILPSYLDIGKEFSSAEMDARKELLVITGKRLQEFPESQILITSAFAAGETEELARKRAESIAQYFFQEWNVALSRIKKKFIHAETEPYCVFSDNGKILSPWIREISERSLAVSPIGLSRFISSEAGVKSWKASITDGKTIVAQFSSEDSSQEEEPVQSLSATMPENKIRTLTAMLDVEDNENHWVHSYDTLAIGLSNEEPVMIKKFLFLLLLDSSQNSLAWIGPLREKILSVVSAHSRIIIEPLDEASESFHAIAGSFVSKLGGSVFVKKIEILESPFRKEGSSMYIQKSQKAIAVTIMDQ